jgi:DNA mismatch repair protein MutS
MALVREYLDLTRKYKLEYGKKTLVLMRVGTFFEVYGLQNKNNGEIHGSEIAEFSRICDLNIAEKKIRVDDDNVLMAGFGHYTIDRYVKRLQESGYTVAIHDQDDNDPTIRKLVDIFSPGTYFSQEITSISNNTTCIWIHVIDIGASTILKKMASADGKTQKIVQVGLANIDIFTGKTSFFEFKETYLKNPTTFDELERFISVYKPSEILMASNLTDEDMSDILNYANVECNTIHKISLLKDNKSELSKRAINSEKQIYQKELFTRFFKIEDYDVFLQLFYGNTMAMQSLCFLLDFIYQHNPNLVSKIHEPIYENCSDRLVLANHSLRQLNMIDDSISEKRGRFSSVEKMLNSCITPMGKRKFTYQLLNPTTDVKYLQNEYNMIEYMLLHFKKFIGLPQKLLHIKDIAKLNRQIILKKVSPQMLFLFYKNLFIVKDIFLSIKEDKTIMDYLNIHTNLLESCDKLIHFFETKMKMELCEDIESFQNFETNFFKKHVDAILDSKSQELSDSIQKLDAIREYFNDILKKMEKGSKSKTGEYVKVYETEKNNFSLICTQKRSVLLKQTLSDNESNITLKYHSPSSQSDCLFVFPISKTLLELQHQTASNESLTTPYIKELCKNITEIKCTMKSLLTTVYNKSIIDNLSEYQTDFDNIIHFITMIDFIYAKTFIAKKYNYCKPTLVNTNKSFVDVKGLRHCLIENIQQNEIYVANDIELGVENGISGVLLYGTNAVGKTSFIRSLGVAVIMAQAGLFVPSSSFHYSPYKYIFTRILGNDDIHKGLSTFAVEMSELRTILRLADHQSLVLGDELCSGTESISAKSIFVAGVQMLSAKKTSYIFATHLHEIIHYEEITNIKSLALKHMEVIYDKQRDMLIYDRKLKDGPGDNMYGLEVCKSLSLPREFLDLANSIRMKYNTPSQSILSLKTSHFNSKKIVSMCEICGNQMSSEVHHLNHQKDANEDGFIILNDGSSVHKNHPANLLSLCEKCHTDIHKRENHTDDKKKPRKTKTTRGITTV